MTSAQWEYSADNTFPGASTTSVIKLVDNSPTNLAITGLTANISYYVRVRYLSSLGGAAFSDWSPTVMFTTAVSFKPGAPSITSPASGAIEQDSNLTITSSAFITTSGDTHQGTSWEVNTNASFSGTSYAAINNSATNKLSLSLVNLPANTTLYARVMHHGVVTGASDWSSPINFRTKTVTINTPSVSGSATVSILTPSFTSTPYALSDPAATLDAHLQSIWEVYAVANPSVIIADSQNSVGSKTAFQVGAGLLSYGTAYAIRVKYIGSLYGESAFSAAFAFSVSAVTVNKPVITITGGAANASLTPSFTSSAFAQTPTAGGLTHIQSLWEVASDASFTTIVATSSGFVIGGTSTLTSWTVGTGTVITPLVNGQNYYARLKHTGSGGIESAWSDTLPFGTVGAATIAVPILSMVSGSGTTTPTLSLSAYATNPPNSPNLIYNSSYIEIASDSNFSSNSIVGTNSQTVPNQNITMTVSAGTLVSGTTYYVRGRHNASPLTFGPWSNVVTLTTGTASLTTAVLTVSNMTWQPLSSNQLTVTVQNAPASIGNLKVQIETQQVGGTWISSGLAADFTQDMPTTSITSGNARSITFNITHSNPGVVDTNWNLRARVYQETLVSNTVTSSSVGPIILKAAAVANNWTATLQGPGSTVGLGMLATFNITLNNAVVGQSYSYSATAVPQGNVSPLPAPTNIGSGTIVATAVNQTYPTNLAFGMAATNTFASFSVSASVVNNGTTKYPGTTVSAAVYTAPVNISSVEFNVAPTTVQPYATATFYVAINGAPSSLGNVKVQIEGWNGSAWVDSPAEFYLKDATVASIVSGNPSRRYIEFTVVHSLPGASDLVVPVRARAYQESNPSNLARSSQIDITLKGNTPQTNVYVRGFTGSSWAEMNPSTVINGDGGAGYVNLAVCAQNLPVAEEQPFIVLITSVDGGQIFYSGQLAALHGDSSWFSTDSQPSNRIYQVSHRAVASHLNSPEFLAHMGYANTGVGWGVGFRHYAEINIEDNVNSRTLAMDVTRQCVITIHSAVSPYPEVARASSYYTFRTRAYLVPAISPG
jgi:hypothetical protein